jgi:hypothetical protein
MIRGNHEVRRVAAEGSNIKPSESIFFADGMPIIYPQRSERAGESQLDSRVLPPLDR